MRGLLLSLIVLILSSAFCEAQDVYLDNMGVYAPYKYSTEKLTPAPHGFKPFYISHIGRHGSRYPVSAGYVGGLLKPLRAADTLGLLTADGRLMLKAVERLDSTCTGMYGYLCDSGAWEHKGIARRMVRRFPEVFDARGRDSISAISTHKQRCIMSATNFIGSLKGEAPKMRVGFTAGDKYYEYLCSEEKAAPGLKMGSAKADEFIHARMDLEAFYSRFFTDPSRFIQTCLKNDRVIPESCFTNGTVSAYLGMPELMHFLQPDEYLVVAQMYNNKMFIQHCGSAEQGEWRVHIMDDLVRDFVERTDAALASEELAADLRFSHDVGLMPFFSLIGLNGFDKALTFEEASTWNSSVLMCMATNLQLVFYRNRVGEVLVRVLLNEAESSFPALGPGPFYSWPELRSYLLGRI